MPSSSIIIPFRNLLSVLLLLPLVLSCRQDELILPVPPVSGKGETAEVTLSVRIPDFRAANTRGVDEKGITEITVLMFADEGGTEKVKVKYDILGSSLHTLSGSSDTKYFSVPVIAGRYKRIALIANAQTELANITPMMLLSKWKSWVGSDKKVRAHTYPCTASMPRREALN